MAFHKGQFKDLITRVLKEYNLYSEAAVDLLLGTAAQESMFGTYLRQLGKGPAVSVFQMEKPTFDWLVGKYKKDFQELEVLDFTDLEWNLKMAILLCRLRYRVVKSPLPAAGDLKGMAKYWKVNYNSVLGHGTEAEYIDNYRKYVE